VVQASPGDQYVYFSNLSFSGNYIYPLPWSCDGNKFYVGTFSESELGFRLYDCSEMQQELSTATNYVLLFDDTCDGIWQITRAKYDDDPVIDDNWAMYDESTWRAYDYHHWEDGEENSCTGQEGNFSEQWIDLGKESWPFSITDSSGVSEGNLDIFKAKDNVQYGENVSQLSLWVQVKNFDGTTFNGTIILEKGTGTNWQCGMMNEVAINLTTSDGVLTDGIGYLDMDLSDLTTSQPTLKFKIWDNTLPTKQEYLTKSFWYAPAEQNMDSDYDHVEMSSKIMTAIQIQEPLISERTWRNSSAARSRVI
jgi:hypothetical protein